MTEAARAAAAHPHIAFIGHSAMGIIDPEGARASAYVQRGID